MSRQAASAWFGIRRQAYYQARQRQLQKAAEDQLLVTLVQGLRQRHPRMGGRKLHHELQEPLAALGIVRGRDAFFRDLLRAHDLLVPVKRSQRRTLGRVCGAVQTGSPTWTSSRCIRSG